MPSTDTSTAAPPPSSYKAALAVMTTLFFMWGFLTELNDVLVPHLKSIFDLNYFQAMLIQFAFFSAYLLFSVPWARVIDWIGYKRTMVAGLFTMALGACLFIPAASAASYPLFLAALTVLAAGITALQVAANPYVAVLGPEKTASSRLNLAQAVNSLGHTTAPWIGGLLILSAAPLGVEALRRMSAEAQLAYRIHEASSVKLPYLVIGLALLALGIAIARFKLPPMPTAERHGAAGATRSLRKHPHLVLGVIAIFLYVGAEVAIGSLLINYLIQPEIGNISRTLAATLVGFCYWGGAMVGRFIGSAILQKAPTRTVLAIAAVMACVLVCTSMLTLGHVAMWSLILVGFFNSVMFPSIFTLGIAELGPLTGDASGLLVMAIVGGAVIPPATGWLADHIGIHHSFILPAACYLYVCYYALKGSQTASTA
ncbi:MAG: sugar MFS transporter [Acidobacteriia bacterium]|nr:sugar MFS transporter [Terriglobia bacterium]